MEGWALAVSRCDTHMQAVTRSCTAVYAGEVSFV
jgi:hypothetical protein